MSLATKTYVLGVLTLSVMSADSLTIVNANFANVAVQCSTGYAYQSYMGGTCAGPGNPQQNIDSGVGFGWVLAPLPNDGNGAATNGNGITDPNTAFNPPSFSGLPFGQAAFLQGANTLVEQTITGFIPGGIYTLNFYLGSRYAPDYGDQTVNAIVDTQVIGVWPLASSMPFTLQTVPFTVTSGGSHTLKFVGTTSGGNTAFLSGVSIEAAGSMTVSPSTGVPGIGLVASAGGFTPFETVNLVAFASAPVAIGTTTADASGVASVAGHLPQTPFGACGLQAVGQSSGKVASGIISARARLAVSPNSGEPGGAVTVTGFGFATGEAVEVEWSNPVTSLGSAQANRNGTFSVQLTIPPGAAAGTNEVVARGQKTGAIAGAQITVE
jgi:hypothetical protein